MQPSFCLFITRLSSADVPATTSTLLSMSVGKQRQGRVLETSVISFPRLVAVSCEVRCQADTGGAFLPRPLNNGASSRFSAQSLSTCSRPGEPHNIRLTHYPLSLPPTAICLFLFSSCPSSKARCTKNSHSPPAKCLTLEAITRQGWGHMHPQ